jgi:levansucrase
MTPFRWTAEHLARIGSPAARAAPLIEPRHAPRVGSDFDLWDHWPALTPGGRLAEVAGGLLVIALTAPILDDPDARHAVARLRLFHRTPQRFFDLGPLLPDGFSPGSREWAGSALFDAADRTLTLYFTAAGERGEPTPTFAQRMFACATTLGDDLRPRGWSEPKELVRPDGAVYETDMAGGGAVGTIKAFRDPYFFRDPAGSGDRLLFAASRAGADSAWNGLVGAARAEGDDWRLEDPWVDATGVNNELERPHAIAHDDRIYLFWSTQAKVFAPGTPPAPTGLYGVVADRIGAPWRPLNGDALVFANPPEAPAQAYSWQVLPDLSVWGFADLVALAGPPADSAEARAHFAGSPAPVLRLTLKDDRARRSLL